MSTTATITTTNCRHCGKPASRHYYGGWCAPAPDRIPSLSGGGICPPREVRTKYEAPTPKPLTENEARDLCRTDETLEWDLNLDKQPTWYGLTSTGARNVYRTIGPKAVPA